MYLDHIRFQNFLTFRAVEIDLVHPQQNFAEIGIPKPHLPNLNLLLGDNGLGKSAFLKGVALAALGPAAGLAGIFPYRLVRREAGAPKHAPQREAMITARFTPHKQDRVPDKFRSLQSEVEVQPRGDFEEIVWREDETPWGHILQQSSDAFFLVGYGASRQVEAREHLDLSMRKRSSSVRAQRVQGLFQEAYSLVPLTAWLPKTRANNPGRFQQVKHLINRLMGPGHYRFTGEMEAGEYLFSKKGLKMPFPALSDGYRAYLGWVSDLLYHVVTTCPPGLKLVENRGIVMVDEIDLHLHPKWQMTVLPILAKGLPKLQFLITSHSPLLVGSLEWMNIIVMEPGKRESSVPRRVETAVHGLDADQVLLTDLFGMESTRAKGKQTQLKDLSLKARAGDMDAAKEFMKQMARGMEKPA